MMFFRTIYYREICFLEPFQKSQNMIIFYQQCFCCTKITREKIFKRYFFGPALSYWPQVSVYVTPSFLRKNDNKEKVVSGQVSILKHFTEHWRSCLGGSVGCAVRLETRRSRVQPPPRSATFFLRSFSPFRWSKKGSCQFLAKECA